MNFPDFSAETLGRLRAGDPAAAAAIARACEPYIRAVVHLRLAGQADLRRAFDSLDIYQSVMGEFFALADRGRLALDSPQQVQALLVRMAVHNLIDKARRKANHVGGLPDDWAGAAAGPPPDETVADREFAEAVRSRLPADQQRLLDLRLRDGWTWAEIAEAEGGTADGARMRLVRHLALARADLDRKEDARDRRPGT